MMDPHAIHGLTLDNDDAESSSSGLSEFDEEYLSMKPPPQKIPKENIIVIEPRKKSKRGGRKSRKKVKPSESNQNVSKNKPTLFNAADEYGITNSYVETDNLFDALKPTGCEFDDNNDYPIFLENVDPVAINTVDSADHKNGFVSIIKTKKKRKKVNEMQSKICELTAGVPNVPKSGVFDASLLSKGVYIDQNGLLSKARKKKKKKSIKKIQLSTHDPKYTLDNCESNAMKKICSENMIPFGINSEVEDTDNPTIRTFQEVIPAKEMLNDQIVSTVHDISDNYNSAQEKLPKSEITDTVVNYLDSKNVETCIIGTEHILCPASTLDIKTKKPQKLDEIHCLHYPKNSFENCEDNITEGIHHQFGNNSVIQNSQNISSIINEITDVDSENNDCTIGSVHSENVDQFVNTEYFCRSQNAIESEVEVKKNVGNEDQDLETESPVERVLGLYWNPNDNNFSLNFGVNKTLIIPQREARSTNRCFENYPTLRTNQEGILENDSQNVPNVFNAMDYISYESGKKIDSLLLDLVGPSGSNKDFLNEQNGFVAKIKKKKRNRKRKKVTSEVLEEINDLGIAQENLTNIAVLDDKDYKNESVYPDIVNQAVINTKAFLNVRNAIDSIGTLSVTQKNIPDSEVLNTPLNAFEISKICYRNQSGHTENMTPVAGTTFSPGFKSIHGNVTDTFEESSVRFGNNSNFQEFGQSTSTRTFHDVIPVDDFYTTDMVDLMFEQSSERVNFKNSSKRHLRVKLRNRKPNSSLDSSDLERFDYVPELWNNTIFPPHYPTYINSLPKKYPSYFELFFKYLYSKRKTVILGIIVCLFLHKSKTPIKGSLGTLASTKFSNDLVEKYFDSSFHINNLFV